MAKAPCSRGSPFVAALFLAAILPAQNQSNSRTVAWTALCPSTHAKPESRCNTIEIEYVGKTDRPVFPIIIGSSAEEADWYKQKLFNDVDSIGGGVYIVRESTMRKIAEISLPNSSMKHASSGDGLKTWPTLRLVLATGRDSNVVIVDAAGSALLLSETKKWVSEYPSLVERLTGIERHVNQYLK